MKKALFVIDTQNYFINDVTKNLPGKIARYIKHHRQEFAVIVFTNFVNPPASSAYRFLGWKKSRTSPDIDIVPELQPLLKYGVSMSKDVYSALKVPEIKTLLKKKKIQELLLCGLDTDCCILATAYDAFDQGYRVKLLEDLCMSSTGNILHEAALSMFKRTVGAKN